MSQIKISSNLFLGSPELKRFQKFLSEDGFRKNLLNNSVSFGLIKNDLDVNFLNAKVIPDADTVISGNTFKTIRYNTISGIDKFGNFLYKEGQTQLPIPDSDSWYWVRISYQISNQEKGVWSIDTTGNLSGTGGELLTILRGQPNFPSKIRFPNANLNTLDGYEILSVTDDNNAVLNGNSFQSESNLNLEVVGTFTYGSPINPDNELIFNYDSCLVELIPEDINSNNVRPSVGFQEGVTFYIARVKIENNQVVIQDKRNNQWETKASYQNQDISSLSNPLIGVENVKYNHPFTPLERNIVEVAWNFRSQNWTINSTTNTITLSSGLGGKYKTVNDVITGDFNGWRIYAPNGTYSKIISSVQQGNAINLQVDFLDVDNFSNDGGLSFLNSQALIVTPNADDIEIIFKPDIADNLTTEIQKFEFQINQDIGTCEVLVYKNPTCAYIVSYRYKSNSHYSPERLLPDDSVGYYNESSFDINNNLLVPLQTTRVPYVSSSTVGFIILTLSSKAYANFSTKVDKGDLKGMTIIDDLSTYSNINLIVGTSLNHLLFTGNLSLSNDITIQLFTIPLINGNEFTIQFDCENLNLNGYNLKIVLNNGIGFTVLKTFTAGDFYQMKNISNGLVIKAVSNGTNWYLSQNYNLGTPGQFKEIHGNPDTLFDINGLGQVMGVYGYGLADGRDGRPDRRGMFTVGYDPDVTDYNEDGATGGVDSHHLTIDKIEQFTVTIPINNDRYETQAGDGAHPFGPNTQDTPTHTDINSYPLGTVGAVPIDNRPSFYTAVIAVQLY